MHLKILKYLPVLFLLILFSGCSLWGNFTTYFNLYYNTSTSFEEAEDLIRLEKRDLFSTEPLMVPGSASQLLNKVVEKSSRILQFHSETAFVDEALIMLGKSFYYQRNYLKALRKFSELIATQPESEFILEAQLWTVKTQMKLKNYTDALDLLQTVRAQAIEEGEDEFIKEAFVEEVVHKIQNEQYEEAIRLTKDFLELSDDEEVNADVVYELGRLYRITGDDQNAILAFQQVYDYAPSYDLDYKANLELGRVLRESGRTEEALDLFADMVTEDKYRDFYDEIDLERGVTLNELNRPEEALEVLTHVDTAFATSLNSGIARLKIGEIYENKLLNYDSATVYYQKASASQAPPEYVVLAASKNRLFTKYNTLASTFRENDKQLRYVESPESFTRDSLEYVTKLQELKIEEDVSYLFELPEVIDTSKTSLDSLAMLKALDSLGVLKSFDSLYVQTELDSLEMTTILDSIKFAQNEEKIKQQQQKQQPPGRDRSGDGDNERGIAKDTSEASKLVMPVKVNIPPDSIRGLLAKNKFDLGNLFFTELNLPDSAYYYYQDIIASHPGSRYEGQTLFALGSYYLIKGDSTAADSLLNTVYENYRTESVVNAAASILKKPLVNLNYDPAEELYIEAEKIMMEENYDSSIVKFYNIFEIFPESPLAPKALYAGGWILENELMLPDSAAVLYDSIVANYPASNYSSRVLPKLNIYKQEIDRIAKAIEDSLAEISSQQEIQSDTTEAGFVPSDTLKTFDLIDKSTDSLYIPEDTLRIEEDINIYGDPDYFEEPTGPVDSLLQMHETTIDSLQGKDRRGSDTTRIFSPPLDSLIPGKSSGDPP